MFEGGSRESSHSRAIGPGVTGGPLAHPGKVSEAEELRYRHGRHRVMHGVHGGHEGVVVDPCGVGAVVGSGAEGGTRQRTQYPYVTGTSVLGVTYKDGVMLACDMLGAYGSTKRYKSFERMKKVNDTCVVAAGGELSDFQHIGKMLEDLADEDFCMDDGHQMKPNEVFSYLGRVMYNRRNKFDPLWNSVVVGGITHAGPFLGTVGMIGTNYTDETVATGFGNHLARPLMRERHRADMDESEALSLLHDCLRVCYYRDKTSINKFQVSKITKQGVEISEPFSLSTKWDYKMFVNPSAKAVGTW